MFFDLTRLVATLNRQRQINVSGLTGSSLSAFLYDLNQFIKPIVLLVPGDTFEHLAEQLPALNLRAVRIDHRCPFFMPADIFLAAPEFFNEKIMVKEEVVFSVGQPVDLVTSVKISAVNLVSSQSGAASLISPGMIWNRFGLNCSATRLNPSVNLTSRPSARSCRWNVSLCFWQIPISRRLCLTCCRRRV